MKLTQQLKGQRICNDNGIEIDLECGMDQLFEIDTRVEIDKEFEINTALKNGHKYAVKVQRSLAPLSWFPGSRKPTAHVHQCCRFQSYAKSRRLHAIANEIYKQNLHCVNHIPGIHDNAPPHGPRCDV